MAPPHYPCTRCGSTEFEEVNAIWFCHNGHEQEGGQQVGEDDGDFGRYGKINRQKETKDKQKIVRVYRGAKGFRLFLKAWQHILWKQCYQLIHDHNLPNKLWNLVRELWSLRLAKLTHRFEEAGEVELNQSSDMSTASDSDLEQYADNDSRRLKTSKDISENPTLIDTISLSYVGILLLRHSTRLSTIYEYIRQERICYIRAIRHVPPEIRERLAPGYHAALDTITVPTQHDLQHAVYQTTMMYSRGFEMVLPSINWLLILMKNIQDLALPLEVLPVVRHLSEILQYRFTYPSQHNTRRMATTYPEAQLMALVVVATKLLYPFDSDTTARCPKTINEPAAVKMNWQVWLEEKKKKEQNDSDDNLKADEAIEVTDSDVMRMPEAQLDQYMDWFQQTYAKDYKENNLHKQILDMFPLHDTESSARNHDNGDYHRQSILARIKTTQSRLQPQRVVPEIEDQPAGHTIMLIRPGQQYQQYLTINSMPETAQHFHSEAARYACLDVGALLRACLSTERLLLLHQHEQRRAKIFGEDDES